VIKWNNIDVKKRKQIFKEKSKDKSLLIKTALLKGMYKGLECVCFLAGPSLCEFEQEKIEKFCENKPVFSLKTSALKFNSITDVCITNHYATFNFPEKRDYIVLSRQETPLGYENWINPDLVDLDTLSNKFENTPDTLWGSDTTARHSRSVINANRWEENLFINSPYNRIIGPGIMNDMVVPLLVHFGIKKVSFLGWDGAKIQDDGTIKHFYDIEKQYKPTLNYVSNKFNLNNLKSDTGECEQQIAVRGEEEVFKFLSSKNIELEILTKNSTVVDKIKRNYILYGDNE
jgi:hypothetical protein